MAGFEFLLKNAPQPAAIPVASPLSVVPGMMQTTADMPALDRSDRELLNALAAFQLRYGKPDEALAVLQLANRLWPGDEQTLRLLTQAFLQVEDYASAEMTDEAWKRAGGGIRATRTDLLRQAVIHFGRGRFAEARQALSACFARREGVSL